MEKCVLCCTVLASTSLKPNNLKRHLKKHLPNSLNKDLNLFKQKAETLIKSRLNQSGMFLKNIVSGLKACYDVLQKIAAAKKTHNIGERLMLPCCKDIISNVLGSSKFQKVKHVSLSNDRPNVSRQINELSDNILPQIVSKSKNSIFKFFEIQIYEMTGVANSTLLCVFVRYVCNKHLEDEFLFCENLRTKTTAREIFDKVDRVFEAHAIE